ncbi:MAG: Gfo/Idh/MocA family oxidoreductase [Gemmatimonadetes bacterium]|nr:Gfo/Idh/MocA family oxidoreductase [Gemmatimonadota bacterium]
MYSNSPREEDVKRIGIIGTGQIAQNHLKQWAKIDEIEVAVACDVDENALGATRETFGIAQGYTDFRELLARDDLDAVDVCLHNNYHAPVAIEALRSGKHVYCEKPIAGSYADGKAMLEVAAETGKMLHIQLSRLYEGPTTACRMVIDAGELGHIYHARATEYRRRGRPYVDGYGTARFVQKEHSGGGALYDMGIYELSRMLYLLGNPSVERITGRIYQEMEMDAARAGEFDVEEFATGMVSFEDNLTMDIVSAWAIHLDAFSPSYIAGSKGGLRVDPFSLHKTVADIDFDMTANVGSVMGRRGLMDPEASRDMSSSQHHWAAALHDRIQLLPTAQLALNTMLIQQGIYLASERGQEVTAEEIMAASTTTAVTL